MKQAVFALLSVAVLTLISLDSRPCLPALSSETAVAAMGASLRPHLPAALGLAPAIPVPLACDQFTGDDTADKIQNCLQSAQAGAILNLKGFEGTQRLSSNPFAAASAPVLILLGSTTFALAEDTTVPKSVSLVFSEHTLFSPDKGKTLRIEGRITSPATRIFTGAGTVVFSDDAVIEALPQWWGAVGDDQTDCTYAIRSAVSSHKRTRLSSGTWRIAAPIPLPSGTSLIGDGPGSILHQARENTPGILPGNQTVIGSFCLRGTGIPATYPNGSIGIQSRFLGSDFVNRTSDDSQWKGARARIEKMRIEEWGQDCIELAPFGTVSNSTLLNCHNEGILISGDYCLIENNSISNTGSWGVDLNSSHTVVSDNLLSNVGNSDVQKWDMGGILISTTKTAAGSNSNLVSGNRIEGSDGNGILLFDASEYSLARNIIRNNIVKDVCRRLDSTFYGGITVQSDGYPSYPVSNNSVIGNRLSNIVGRGIEIVAAKSTEVRGNTITNTAGAAIRAVSHRAVPPEDLSITGNVIQGRIPVGIQIIGGKNATVTKNTVSWSEQELVSGPMVELKDTEDFAVHDNSLSGPGSNCKTIFIEYADSHEAQSGNRIEGCKETSPSQPPH